MFGPDLLFQPPSASSGHLIQCKGQGQRQTHRGTSWIEFVAMCHMVGAGVEAVRVGGWGGPGRLKRKWNLMQHRNKALIPIQISKGQFLPLPTSFNVPSRKNTFPTIGDHSNALEVQNIPKCYSESVRARQRVSAEALWIYASTVTLFTKNKNMLTVRNLSGRTGSICQNISVTYFSCALGPSWEPTVLVHLRVMKIRSVQVGFCGGHGGICLWFRLALYKRQRLMTALRDGASASSQEEQKIIIRN